MAFSSKIQLPHSSVASLSQVLDLVCNTYSRERERESSLWTERSNAYCKLITNKDSDQDYMDYLYQYYLTFLRALWGWTLFHFQSRNQSPRIEAEQRLVASSYVTVHTSLRHMWGGRENQYTNDYNLNLRKKYTTVSEIHTGWYLRTRSRESTQTLAQECYVSSNVICTSWFIHRRSCVVLGLDLSRNLSSGTPLQWQVPGCK